MRHLSATLSAVSLFATAASVQAAPPALTQAQHDAAHAMFEHVINTPTVIGRHRVPEMAQFVADQFKGAGFPAEDVQVMPYHTESATTGGDDTAALIVRWRAAGKDIAIFSSGSIQAQRNLFANTTAGDLSVFVSDYFDTTTGPKQLASSYRRIAERLGHSAGQIQFVSDVTAELDAAREAGMRTVLCMRGSTLESSSSHARVSSFDELA